MVLDCNVRVGDLAGHALAPPQEQDNHDKILGGEHMFSKAWDWAKQRNIYLLPAALGLFGVFDALTPGSRSDHIFGVGIVIISAYVWLVQ